jgi:type IV secretory pathway component VirB8
MILKNWKVKKTKTLKQTKSYANKEKHNFLQRRNTYNKNELKTNYSFNIFIGNNSKDKEESNFASLISEKKREIFLLLRKLIA